jgi:hypothetical protein
MRYMQIWTDAVVQKLAEAWLYCKDKKPADCRGT